MPVVVIMRSRLHKTMIFLLKPFLSVLHYVQNMVMFEFLLLVMQLGLNKKQKEACLSPEGLIIQGPEAGNMHEQVLFHEHKW